MNKMGRTPTYRGYISRMEVDAEAGLIHGEVVGLRDVITFQGETPAEAVQAFRESIDDYLDYCAEIGREPEKSYSGKVLVRTKPEVHRALTALAAAQKVSVNKLASSVLTRYTMRRIARPTAKLVEVSTIEPRKAPAKRRNQAPAKKPAK